MTRFTASVTVGDTAKADASFIVVDGKGCLIGAEILPLFGHPGRQAVHHFEELTQRPLLARRHQYGDSVPDDLVDSDTWLDVGVPRKAVLTFSPGRGSSPQALGRFLAQCRDAGLVVSVTLWPEMHRFMPAAQYKVLCETYVPVIHANGYTHTFCVSNFAAVTKNACEVFWPGDDLADDVAVVFYPSGLSLAAASQFADAKAKPFGIAEMGVSADGCDSRENASFALYVQEFFAARVRDGLPCTDIIWLSGHRDGDFRMTGAVAETYRLMYDTLIT